MQLANKKNEKKSRSQTVDNILNAISLQEKIETRAHEIYLARGAEPGHELDDWLQAEREIMGWV